MGDHCSHLMVVQNWYDQALTANFLSLKLPAFWVALVVLMFFWCLVSASLDVLVPLVLRSNGLYFFFSQAAFWTFLLFSFKIVKTLAMDFLTTYINNNKVSQEVFYHHIATYFFTHLQIYYIIFRQTILLSKSSIIFMGVSF